MHNTWWVNIFTIQKCSTHGYTAMQCGILDWILEEKRTLLEKLVRSN